jgi:hypothetical protein
MFATHNGRESVKGGKKRHKQHLPRAVITTGHGDGNDWEAGGSGMKHTSTTAHSDKRQARPPIDHFKRLLQEAYPTRCGWGHRG